MSKKTIMHLVAFVTYLCQLVGNPQHRLCWLIAGGKHNILKCGSSCGIRKSTTIKKPCAGVTYLCQLVGNIQHRLFWLSVGGISHGLGKHRHQLLHHVLPQGLSPHGHCLSSAPLYIFSSCCLSNSTYGFIHVGNYNQIAVTVIVPRIVTLRVMITILLQGL